jgi:hypothetical protein
MKIFTVCAECMREDIANADTGFVEVNNDGVYRFKCSKGHLSFNAVQEQVFEILFEYGCHAMLDGYYREAISSFTSALERFYEFYIKLVCIKNDIKKNHRSKVWKKVSNQSERQLGAFIFLWTTEFKETPILLKDGDIKFRNDVIHKGKIPTQEDAEKYGQSVLNLFNNYLPKIKHSYSDEISIAVREHIVEVNNKIPEGSSRSGSSQSTIISLNSEIDLDKTFNERLENVRYWHRQYKKTF